MHKSSDNHRSKGISHKLLLNLSYYNNNFLIGVFSTYNSILQQGHRISKKLFLRPANETQVSASLSSNSNVQKHLQHFVRYTLTSFFPSLRIFIAILQQLLTKFNICVKVIHESISHFYGWKHKHLIPMCRVRLTYFISIILNCISEAVN